MIDKDQRPTTKNHRPIAWENVRHVLVIRLRSIGDTVLATPSLIALKRFLPHSRMDILLEDWVAPLLDEFDAVDDVITVGRSRKERLKTALRLRQNRYDVVFNLHGGTTSTFFAWATRAPHRVGFANYRYAFLYDHLLPSASDFWGRSPTHSAEQQLALLGFVGVPVEDLPKSRLTIANHGLKSLNERLAKSAIRDPRSAFALIHPAAAFATKTWAAENFARTAEFLSRKNIQTVAIAAWNETSLLERLVAESSVPIITFSDLSLPEIIALASKARLFVGNDSGIAHIAAAVGTPSVVIFGSSNRDHWRPWTYAPNEIVYEPFPCQPCPGYECKEFGDPRCILELSPDRVFPAIDKVLKKN